MIQIQIELADEEEYDLLVAMVHDALNTKYDGGGSTTLLKMMALVIAKVETAKKLQIIAEVE